MKRSSPATAKATWRSSIRGGSNHYHRLEREQIHLLLLEEASKGWEDVEQGRTLTVAQVRAKYKVAKKR